MRSSESEETEFAIKPNLEARLTALFGRSGNGEARPGFREKWCRIPPERRRTRVGDRPGAAGSFQCASSGAPRLELPGEPVCVSLVARDHSCRSAKMPKQTKTLQDLFHETLKDIYYAEKKILTSLPKMAKAARSSDLRAAFEKHERETEGQIQRLEQVFALIGEPAKGKTCDAINGIVEEGKEIITEFKGSPALDAGLLAAAQAVEHYEISRYGTLMTWAGELGLKDAVALLDQTLQQEKKTDEALTALAESAVNQEAQQAAE
jgi:ferritin-like metal-binding protein YciE